MVRDHSKLGAGGWAGPSVSICAWLAEPVGSSGGFQSLCWLYCLQAASTSRASNTPLPPNLQTIAMRCSWSQTYWPVRNHSLCTMLQHIFLPTLARGSDQTCRMVCKVTCHKIPNQTWHPFQGFGSVWECNPSGADAGELHLSVLPCLPPGGSYRLCRRQTFRKGHLTLGDKLYQGLRSSIRLIPFQFFAFSKLTRYK